MLAEIYLMRLQAMLRTAGSEQQPAAIAKAPRFVPIEKRATTSSGNRRAS